MRTRIALLASLAVGFMGLGVLVGSVVGGASAQTQTPGTGTTPTQPKVGTTPSTNAAPGATAVPGAPGARPGKGMSGAGAGKHGGPGGPGCGHGPGARAATAEGATAAIDNTAAWITLVKGDLTAANGKMDTSDVQKWVNGADALLNTARTANTATQYEKAVGYASAARELASAAELQMRQALGAANLPSYNQNQGRREGKLDPANATVTQAQASRILARTYDHLIAQGTLVSAANNAEATTYLTDAQDAYKDAYAAYQAGDYTEAVQKAKLAEQLAHVTGHIIGASRAPNTTDAPVTVPAPNF